MANLYDLKKFDLNLLVIFEYIYRHLSISKTAAALYITPSAISQSLQRLHTQFNGPLFIRSDKGITSTVTGVDLHLHLEKSLSNLEQTINIIHGPSLRNKFVIYSPQIITSLNIASLINSLREDSDIEIERHDILMSTETAENVLAYHEADLVITTTPVHSHSIVCARFKTVDYVLVYSDNHPGINETGAPEQIQQEQSTCFSSEDQGTKDYRSRAGGSMAFHKVGFSSDSLLSIANVIVDTDVTDFLPKQAYELYQSALKFKEIKTSSELPKVKLFIVYNRASLNHEAFAEYINKLSLDS